MKILLFGDGPELKEKGKALREQHDCSVHLRSIQRWVGDVEKVDAVYFIERAEAIRTAYTAQGVDCFLTEETGKAPGEDGSVISASAGSDSASEAGSPPASPGASADAAAASSGRKGSRRAS
jgi:hypothetical protein